MLNEEEVLGGGFLDADSSKYFLGGTNNATSSSINRSLSMPPLYSSQLSVDANPWNTDSQFETAVPDIGQNSTGGQNAVDDDILGTNLTAASVLVGVDLPETYDTAYLRARPVGERVSLDSLEKVIELAELSPRIVQEILNIVVPVGAMYVTHNEFNTAIALVACEQKNMDVSLQTVYQHRNDLPSPILLNLDQFNVKRATQHPNILKQQQHQQQQRSTTTNKMDDPWLSVPNGHVNNTNGKLEEIRSAPTSMSRPKLGLNNGSTTPSRSRSMDNTHQIQQQQPNGSDNNNNHHHHDQLLRPDENGKFLNDHHDHHHPIGPTDSYQWFLDLDLVKVAVAPEKEGFIFKHVNYVIESQLRSSKVLRRYSDFYWLWETLLKRYPMRVIPNLPPKKLGGKDESFLEKRRKGLSRFINSIVRHPTLKCDQVVETFLTEPSELLAWRRANPPIVDEEFVRNMPNATEFECYIPQDLDTRLESIKSRLPIITDHYNNKCIVLDRLIRICEVQSREFVRYSITLNAMSEVEQECYVPGCQSCSQVVRGYETVAKHMQRAGTILDEQALAAANGVLENLKRHRDLLISFKEMIERKERLELNQIDSLSKKISANKAKVNQNRGVPGLESEVERLDIAIQSDQDKLTYQLNRDTHIRYCITSELSYIHKQQAFISLMYQNYVHEQLQFTRQLGDNWKVLQGLSCEMPIDPDEFV